MENAREGAKEKERMRRKKFNLKRASTRPCGTLYTTRKEMKEKGQRLGETQREMKGDKGGDKSETE